ncbi:cytochrome c biogenesis protein CcdA [Candidatus Woesearchaeota archaeon]|nr:cytochrome c biogenesis protein CcdA [Candidatus Woesearchaeota archaeon]
MKNGYFSIIACALLIVLAGSASAQTDLPIGLQTCGIALLPAFFSVAFKDRKKAVLMSVAFSAGLLAAFTLFGLIAGILGDFFNQYKLAFAVISGYILIFFAILMFFNSGFSIFSFRLDYSKGKGFFSVALLGFFFGVGWTPCAGPILYGTILLAANSSTVLSGVLMLVFYGIGIIAPLIALAYFSDRYDWVNSRFLRGKEINFSLFGKKIATHAYNIMGGILLLAIGILMIIYKGTFFFQSELPRYIPWSMSLLYTLNEEALGSGIFLSDIGNILGLIIASLILVFIIAHLRKQKSDVK